MEQKVASYANDINIFHVYPSHFDANNDMAKLAFVSIYEKVEAIESTDPKRYLDNNYVVPVYNMFDIDIVAIEASMGCMELPYLPVIVDIAHAYLVLGMVEAISS